MALRVTSFNCFSLRKKIDVIRDILNKSDIVFLQETLLSQNDIKIAQRIDYNFQGYHIPSYDPNILGLNGRLIGGLSIYWKNQLGNIIKPVPCSDNIVAVRLSVKNLNVLIVNVYMPCDNRDLNSLLKYRHVCAQLSAFIETENELSPINKVIICGDINADPNKGRFWHEFCNFAKNENLYIVDVDMLQYDSFTYVSHFNSTSWLDHIVTSDTNIIKNIKIHYGTTCYDHVPISFSLAVPDEYLQIINYNSNKDNDESSLNVKHLICWNKLTKNDLLYYSYEVDELLKDYSSEAFYCNDNQCDSQRHREFLEKDYNFLINILQNASYYFSVEIQNKQFKPIPGWNDACKSLYANARDKFLIWNEKGRLRSGDDYENMKMARSNFKTTLQKCKNDEKIIRKNKLANEFLDKNKRNFWNYVNKLKNNTSVTPTRMDNACTKTDILNIFNNKFRAIFDDKECQIKSQDYDTKLMTLKTNLKNSSYSIYDFNIVEAINKLNEGIDLNSMHSNHFKHAAFSIKDFLSKLFSSFISHGFVPPKMLQGEIRPIIKDRFGDLSDSNNYRPITISTMCLKIFEYCILQKMQMCLKLHANQFGFRQHTSTTMAAAVLKEIIMTYNEKSTPVYAAFLDLSKAFDKINHSILMSKLIDSTVPAVITNTIINMYDSQYVRTYFNGTKGSFWKLRNGTRQGAVLSPLLFCYYIDEVLIYLNKLNIGCNFGIYKHNSQAYADDFTLISPSASALQILIDKVHIKFSALNLKLNTDKSNYMVFNKKKSKIPTLFLNNNKLKNVMHCKYLGIIFTENLCNKDDILRCELSFLKQFYSIYRRFHFVDRKILTFLFKSHCLSFYGSELWFSLRGCITTFKNLSINFHKCIKKMGNVSWFTNNHDICEEFGLQTFKHFINKKILYFINSLMNSKSPCFNKHKIYFKNFSCSIKMINKLFFEAYSICNVSCNDLDAVKARIDFVEAREERRRFVIGQ